MIDVILTDRCICKLKKELRAAGSNEIGGVLAAEQVADGKFVVRDISIQRDGTFAHFKRDPAQHRVFMRRFHMRMGNQPERFNYLGEWHSHPSFLALPSGPDLRQMQELIEDKEQLSSFLVLMVVKLGRNGGLLGTTYAFRRQKLPVRVRLKAEGTYVVREEGGITAPGALRAWHRFQG